MQDRQVNASSKEKSKFGTVFLVVKLAVTAFIFYYIYTSVTDQVFDREVVVRIITSVLSTENTPELFLFVILCPVNWLLEAVKWKMLAGKVIKLSLPEALRSILIGLAFGVAVPAQLGDTVGRVASLRSKERLMAIGPAMISNGIQFYVSVLIGLICFWNIRQQLPLSDKVSNTVVGIALALIVLGILVAVYRSRLTNWKGSYRFLEKFRPHIAVMGEYTVAELLGALVIGLMRYFVFMGQFLLALSLFNFPVSLAELCYGVGTILLAKTLIPAINIFGDLGTREFTALFVFQSLNVPALQVVCATLMVWAINILGPVLIGMMVIWRRRFNGS